MQGHEWVRTGEDELDWVQLVAVTQKNRQMKKKTTTNANEPNTRADQKRA